MIFSCIICGVAFWFTWCFQPYSGFLNGMIKLVSTIFSVGVMFAQFGYHPRLIHFSWIFEYTLYVIILHKILDITPFAGLLENDVMRKIYQPSAEEKLLAMNLITIMFICIFSIACLANCAIDKYLLRPEPQPDIEAVEGDRPKPFIIVLKEMYSDMTKMLTIPFSPAALKSLFKDVNDSYKKVIDKPIKDNEKASDNKHVVKEYLKYL